MRPGVARQYLKEVVDGFDAYARRRYVPTLCDVEADADHQVAGARFVATRAVEGQEGCLRELLETSRIGRRRGLSELDEACADALLATCEDELSASRLLARVATDRRTSMTSSRVFERRLAHRDAIGVDAVLLELSAAHHDRVQLRRLVRLLIRISDIAPPQPLGKWIDLPIDARRAVVDAWGAKLIAAGKLGGGDDDESGEVRGDA